MFTDAVSSVLKWSKTSVISRVVSYSARLALSGFAIWLWWHYRGVDVSMNNDLLRYGSLTNVEQGSFMYIELVRHLWLLIPILFIESKFNWKQLLVIVIWCAAIGLFVSSQFTAYTHYQDASSKEVILKGPTGPVKL